MHSCHKRINYHRTPEANTAVLCVPLANAERLCLRPRTHSAFRATKPAVHEKTHACVPALEAAPPLRADAPTCINATLVVDRGSRAVDLRVADPHVTHIKISSSRATIE